MSTSGGDDGAGGAKPPGGKPPQRPSVPFPSKDPSHKTPPPSPHTVRRSGPIPSNEGASRSTPPSRLSPTPPSLISATRKTPVPARTSAPPAPRATPQPPAEDSASSPGGGGPRKLMTEEELSRARSAPTQKAKPINRISPTPPSLVDASGRRSPPLSAPPDDDLDEAPTTAKSLDEVRAMLPPEHRAEAAPPPVSERARSSPTDSPLAGANERTRPSPTGSPATRSLPPERGSRPSPSPTGLRRSAPLLPVQTRGSASAWPVQGRGSSGNLPGADRRSSGRISAPAVAADGSSPSTDVTGPRETAWWIIAAHTLGAAALGGLDLARLGSLSLALAVVPLFAAMGLMTGALIAGLEKLVVGRRWWVAALVLTAPALLVYVPVARSLFQGAYAQTLPLAGVAPYLAPPALWLGSALVLALFRRILRARDLTTRAIVVLAIAGAMGGIIIAERNVLRGGYPTAHLGATLALIVLVGCGVRITRRGGVSYLGAAVLTGLTLGGAIIACLGGLKSPADRQLLATYGDQSRDLVALWRNVLDLDRDGSSYVLGGGDCDDTDPLRHPGAVDKPGDGIDQDCDGSDAELPSTVEHQPAATKQHELASWKATPDIAQLLDRTRGMHVLVVSVDALRADLLAPDALHRDDFPVITKLLGDSVWFTRAFAPAAGTDISLATLLTGRFDPFQPIATTLPEAMQAAGRRTFAALPAEVQRYAGETLLGRGIDKLVTVHTDWGKENVGDHVSAPATTNEGIKAIDELGDKPGFVWVHYFDVHEHHQIDVPKRLRDAVRDGGTAKTHAYRALLRAIDNELGRLFEELTKRELLDRTIVVFISDHGESLGDDARLGDTHGKVTYATLTRVPIAIRIPGVTPGIRTEQISLVDLAPTLLALTGVPPAGMQLDGLDLVPVLLDGPATVRPSPRPIAIHEELQWSIVDWPHQLIVRPADNLFELYNLDSDPGQREDLAQQLPDVVSQLKAQYAQFPPVTVDRTPNGRSERERLARQRPPRTP